MYTQIDTVVDAMDFGTASAAKRGRNPSFPYVPVIKRETPFGTWTENPTRHVAYATRAKAVERAQHHIDAAREATRKFLKEPRARAMRVQHGLPKELPDHPHTPHAGHCDFSCDGAAS